MAYYQRPLLTDQYGKPVPQMYDLVNDVFVPIVKMDYYGKSTDVKPSPTIAPIGATFTELDTQRIYQNDGTTWMVI